MQNRETITNESPNIFCCCKLSSLVITFVRFLSTLFNKLTKNHRRRSTVTHFLCSNRSLTSATLRSCVPAIIFIVTACSYCAKKRPKTLNKLSNSIVLIHGFGAHLCSRCSLFFRDHPWPFDVHIWFFVLISGFLCSPMVFGVHSWPFDVHIWFLVFISGFFMFTYGFWCSPLAF